MKYLTILCMLFASCSIFKKSVNTQKHDMAKHSLSLKDSTGITAIDSTAIRIIEGWKKVTFDSVYDIVIGEVVKDYGDSIITFRTTKEKGQKKTEQLSHISKYDSAGSIITEHSQLQELAAEDSSAV